MINPSAIILATTNNSPLIFRLIADSKMSPIAYIKAQRLNGVRRTLKKADPETTMVMSLAQQWGFWSNGHFARDYQKMLGELPSETLQGTSKSQEI